MFSWLRLVIFVMFGQGPCLATVFGFEDDVYMGGEAACLGRPILPGEVGVAVRDLACGTRVLLWNPRTGREVVAKVIDHGPYGAIFRGRWRVKRNESEPGVWRGCVDMTRETARKLGHNGLEKIFYAPLAHR